MATQMNGINVEVLGQTVSAIKGDPELGQCRFQTTNRWLDGDRNVSAVKTFYAAKQQMTHQQTFEMQADEPALLAGDDSAANPVEHLLMALSACLTTSLVAHAASQGIEIQELESEVEGDIDLNGFFGLSADTARGYQQIRVKIRVKSDEDTEKLKQLAKFSPVFNTISKGAPIEMSIEKKAATREAEVGQNAAQPS